MIPLTRGIWIGDGADEAYGDLCSAGVKAILNVAQDLPSTRGWRQGIEYMHVGLIDGPGNPTTAYYAAVLALATLLKWSHTMVCCHSGSRSMAVVLMYLSVVMYDRELPECLEAVRELTDSHDLPKTHPAHSDAFAKMNWRLLRRLVTEETT